MPDFTITPEVKGMRQKVGAFMDEHIYPNEHFLLEGGADRESLMKELQGKTKKMGMRSESTRLNSSHVKRSRMPSSA